MFLKAFLLFCEPFVKPQTGDKMAKEEPFGTICPGIVPESLCALSHFVPIEVALRKNTYLEMLSAFIENRVWTQLHQHLVAKMYSMSKRVGAFACLSSCRKSVRRCYAWRKDFCQVGLGK
jgi:hypothetical protein